MDDMDIEEMVALIKECGVKDVVAGLIQALHKAADEFSDDGLKEKAVQAANMADVLAELNG